MKHIIYNAIRTPDGTLMESRYVHDYKTHIDYNGEVYMVDGGKSYLRRNVTKEPAEELTLYIGDDHDLIRQRFTWGSFGPNGDQPMKITALKDLSIDHIKAILETQVQLPDYVLDLFGAELRFRQEIKDGVDEL